MDLDVCRALAMPEWDWFQLQQLLGFFYTHYTLCIFLTWHTCSTQVKANVCLHIELIPNLWINNCFNILVFLYLSTKHIRFLNKFKLGYMIVLLRTGGCHIRITFFLLSNSANSSRCLSLVWSSDSSRYSPVFLRLAQDNISQLLVKSALNDALELSFSQQTSIQEQWKNKAVLKQVCFQNLSQHELFSWTCCCLF